MCPLTHSNALSRRQRLADSYASGISQTCCGVIEAAVGRACFGRFSSVRRQCSSAPARSEGCCRLYAPPPYLLRELNTRLGRFEVDFLWRAERLVVEVDGYAFHGGRAAFERDRRRDAELQAEGLRVMRVTWRQLVGEPDAVVARLTRALRRNPD